MALTMHGHWRLRVTQAHPSGNNRFVVTGATSGNGTFPLEPGTEVEVSGLPDWELDAQFEDEQNPGTWISFEVRIQEQDRTRATLPTTLWSFHEVTTDDGNLLVPRGDIWEGTFLGHMMEIPYRPWAIRPQDLFEMPDGVFDAALGRCYMGVRIRNSWGHALTGAVHVITQESRADLASRGIEVLDGVPTYDVGQGTIFDWPYHGDVQPGDSVTSYFQLDVAAAVPDKHDVEFFVYDRAWAVKDPESPQRRATRKIFVTRSGVDHQTGELTGSVREGELRLLMRELAVDRRGARDARRPLPPRRRDARTPSSDDLRRVLDALLRGEKVDLCEVRRIWECACDCGLVTGGGSGTPRPGRPSNGRFSFDPFYAFPTRFRYRVTPDSPFPGQFGPIPFDDPWWKLLLLVIALLLWLFGLLVQAADNAYNEDKLIIGKLGASAQHDLDVAFAVLNGSRATGSPLMRVLDAQSDEFGVNPVEDLDGVVALTSPIMTKDEVEQILANTSLNDPVRKVFKSGARTGMTHGRIIGSSPRRDPRDDGTVFAIEQLRVGEDEDFGEMVSNKGDSGSIWVHSESRRPIALNHSGSREANTASASFLEDIAKRFGVTF